MRNHPFAMRRYSPAKWIYLLILLMIGFWCPASVLGSDVAAQPASVAIRLQEILTLPVPIEGAFVGSADMNEGDSAVIVAGGATAVVAQDLPKSTFENRIYYCGPRAHEWKLAKLHSALAFGGTATADGAMYCVGGVGIAGLSDKIFKLGFEKGTLVQKDLARLPQPLAASGVAVMDGKLYVVGGLKQLSPMQASDLMWCIDLRNKDARWESQPLSNGGIIAPVAGVRRDEIQVAASLIVVGGWCLDPGGMLNPVSKAWKFLPKALAWSAPVPGSARLRDAGPAQAKVWTELADLPVGLTVVAAAPIGPSHLLVLANRPGKSQTGLAWSLAHAGPPQLVNYHTYTDTWVDVPLTPPSAAGASSRPLGMGPMGNEIALLVNQDRSTLVYDGSFAYAERHFGIADYTVIFLYLLGILGIGHFFSRREKNTEDYFLGGRKIPWWAAGMSIWASLISAISSMAIPAKTYQQNWTYISLGLIPFFTTIIAAYVFVPMLRRLPVTTMMEYLELRFHYSYRIIATVLAVIGQVAGRMAVTLLLPALALQAVSGMDIGGAARSAHAPAVLADFLHGKDLYVCILMMGGVATAYTVFGGIKAVVWTDVAQCLVMFSAAIMTFVYVIAGVDGGIAGTVKICLDHNKLQCFNGAFDLTVASVWVFMIWGVNDIYAKLDQIHMQRAFATDSAKSARRAMLTGGWISLPASLIFYATGSALFAYYHSHPGQLRPTLQTDSILPLFIVQHVPAGVAGLVIAGIFATGMNTLSASMNMVATVVVRDWYAFFDRQGTESTRLRTARLITFATGVLGTSMACWLAYLQIGSVWDTFSKLMGWLGGGFGCVGLLGMLTRRASTLGTLVGVIVSTLALIWVSLYTNLSFFAWGTFTLLVGCIVGYLASLVLPDRARNLEGLTVWTPKPQQATP